MPYATPGDVQSRLGRELDPAETGLVTIRLADAERLIRKRIRDLDDQVTAGTIDAEDVKQIQAEAVLRLVRNPEGYTSESDGNYSYQFSSQAASGKLEILAAEWQTLGVQTGGMFCIVPNLVRPL